MKGILLAGGSGTRLYPVTMVISKQLLPVYDKPMVYYPLSLLMLAGIREVLLISTPQDISRFELLLGDGSDWGMKIQYKVQDKPEGIAQAFVLAKDFLDGQPSCLVLGDNVLYGAKLEDLLVKASKLTNGAYVFSYIVADPERYGVVVFDKTGKATHIEEKPKEHISKYAIPGIYFYDSRASEIASRLKPSARGELEVTDLNKFYLNEGTLNVLPLGRGYAWLDMGTFDSLLDASEYIAVIERRQSLKVACLEEIAYRNKWISKKEVLSKADELGKTKYADYLRALEF
ncbi:MAG: glucose-1-phosphate thymidylyltransferase RfbA [bacterium]